MLLLVTHTQQRFYVILLAAKKDIWSENTKETCRESIETSALKLWPQTVHVAAIKVQYVRILVKIYNNINRMCRNESFDVMTSMFYVSIKPASNSPSQPIPNTLLSAEYFQRCCYNEAPTLTSRNSCLSGLQHWLGVGSTGRTALEIWIMTEVKT